MAFLGRTPSNAPLTSADIPDDIIQGGDIAYLENDSTTHNLGGTYSTERMYLNDSYTLTGDVNVTNHLALGTIADSDVVITNDSSARTITGSGLIEAGRLMNDPVTSLSDTVTGSPNLNLVNASFPAGHILYTQYDSYSTQTTIGNTNTYILNVTFNTKGANSRILVLTNFLYGASGDLLGFHGGMTMTTGSSASTDYDGDAIQLGATTSGTMGLLFHDDIGNGRLNSYGIQVWYGNASKVTSYAKDTQITIGLWLNGDTTMYINRSEARATASEMNISTMTVFEVAT